MGVFFWGKMLGWVWNYFLYQFGIFVGSFAVMFDIFANNKPYKNHIKPYKKQIKTITNKGYMNLFMMLNSFHLFCALSSRRPRKLLRDAFLYDVCMLFYMFFVCFLYILKNGMLFICCLYALCKLFICFHMLLHVFLYAVCMLFVYPQN